MKLVRGLCTNSVSRFTLQLGARKWVFCNSMHTARELLDRRGKLYVGRPDFPITQDILSGGNRIVMMTYNERWRNLRKIMHQLLMASNVGSPRKVEQLANSHGVR